MADDAATLKGAADLKQRTRLAGELVHINCLVGGLPIGRVGLGAMRIGLAPREQGISQLCGRAVPFDFALRLFID